MSYGELTPKMRKVLRAHAKGKVVYALGSGSGEEEGTLLARAGASFVCLVDKAGRGVEGECTPRMWTALLTQQCRGERCTLYFHEFLDRVTMGQVLQPDVVFVKWPQTTHLPGFVELLSLAPVVIYIGRNDGITACGPPQMWMHFRKRELLDVVRGGRNDMLVYGGPAPWAERPRCREEANTFST